MKSKSTLFLVLDTETTRPKKQSRGIVFDLGYKIVDRYGNAYGQASFLATDVLSNHGPFYYNKIGRYYDMAYDKEIFPVPFNVIQKAINLTIKDLHNKGYEKVIAVGYNAKFDFGSLDNTSEKLLHKKFLQVPVKYLCLWHYWSLNCPLNYKGPRTPSGKLVSTKAEHVYAFEFKKPAFIEEHTGYADASIEAELLLRVLNRSKGRLPTYNHYKDIPGGIPFIANRRLGIIKQKK
mgnify:CR=1 FL=1